MAISYIFTRFGTFYPFWYVVPRKIWQPCFTRGSEKMQIKFLAAVIGWQPSARKLPIELTAAIVTFITENTIRDEIGVARWYNF
jgi:hypothetical protein